MHHPMLPICRTGLGSTHAQMRGDGGTRTVAVESNPLHLTSSARP
jgi:hypothetical protein